MVGTERDGIDDMDLLAYADGRLASDPSRSRRVEAWLSAHPEAAFKVHAYRDQNAALRRAYGPRLGEPVPDRLYRAVEKAPPRIVPRLARLGAVAALMGVATGLGWMAGQHGATPDRPMDEFLEQSFSHSIGTALDRDETGSAVRTGSAGPSFSPADWLTESVPPALRVPELGKLGYAMTSRQTLETGGEPLVRLTYEGQQGRRFHLFLRPRWDVRATDVQLARKDGLSLAYWLDGPLASAIVADAPPEEALAIANAVREAMTDARQSPPIQASPVQASPIQAAPAVSPLRKTVADGAGDAALTGAAMPGTMLPALSMPASQPASGK